MGRLFFQDVRELNQRSNFFIRATKSVVTLQMKCFNIVSAKCLGLNDKIHKSLTVSIINTAASYLPTI